MYYVIPKFEAPGYDKQQNLLEISLCSLRRQVWYCLENSDCVNGYQASEGEAYQVYVGAVA